MPINMADEAGAAKAPDGEVVSALRKLAGRDIRAVVAADGTCAVLARSGGGNGERRRSQVSKIAAVVWRELTAGGLVVPEGHGEDGHDCWRISNAGRIHLRRLLSRCDPGAAGDDVGDARTCGRAHPPGFECAEGPPSRGKQAALEALSESPLAWLARRRDKSGRTLISEDEFHAGERLRADFTLGQMMAKVTSNWSPMGGYAKRGAKLDAELSMSEAVIDARERVRAALAEVGPELSGVLIDVCCYLKGLEATERAAGWPQRSGKLVLQIALRSLARHYKSRRSKARADAA